VWKNRLKPYDLLNGEEVEAIHEQAMTILEEIGVDFLHDRAREIFGKAGMKVEDNRVRFDRAFVMEQVAKTPATFDLQARNPARSVILGGDNVVTAPVYGPPFITTSSAAGAAPRLRTSTTSTRWPRPSIRSTARGEPRWSRRTSPRHAPPGHGLFPPALD